MSERVWPPSEKRRCSFFGVLGRAARLFWRSAGGGGSKQEDVCSVDTFLVGGRERGRRERASEKAREREADVAVCKEQEGIGLLPSCPIHATCDFVVFLAPPIPHCRPSRWQGGSPIFFPPPPHPSTHSVVGGGPSKFVDTFKTHNGGGMVECSQVPKKRREIRGRERTLVRRQEQHAFNNDDNSIPNQEVAVWPRTRVKKTQQEKVGLANRQVGNPKRHPQERKKQASKFFVHCQNTRPLIFGYFPVQVRHSPPS